MRFDPPGKAEDQMSSVCHKRGHENMFSGFDDVAIRSEKNPKSFSELVGEISPFST
jgi:hypothetical protein